MSNFSQLLVPAAGIRFGDPLLDGNYIQMPQSSWECDRVAPAATLPLAFREQAREKHLQHYQGSEWR